MVKLEELGVHVETEPASVEFWKCLSNVSGTSPLLLLIGASCNLPSSEISFQFRWKDVSGITLPLSLVCA